MTSDDSSVMKPIMGGDSIGGDSIRDGGGPSFNATVELVTAIYKELHRLEDRIEALERRNDKG